MVVKGIEKYSEVQEIVRVAAKNLQIDLGLYWKVDLIVEIFGCGIDRQLKNLFLKTLIKNTLIKLRLK